MSLLCHPQKILGARDRLLQKEVGGTQAAAPAALYAVAWDSVPKAGWKRERNNRVITNNDLLCARNYERCFPVSSCLAISAWISLFHRWDSEAQWHCHPPDIANKWQLVFLPYIQHPARSGYNLFKNWNLLQTLCLQCFSLPGCTWVSWSTLLRFLLRIL